MKEDVSEYSITSLSHKKGRGEEHYKKLRKKEKRGVKKEGFSTSRHQLKQLKHNHLQQLKHIQLQQLKRNQLQQLKRNQN